MFQIVVTNSLPQSANVARMGSKIEVIDISGGIFFLQIVNILRRLSILGMVSEFIRRSHYNESVRQKENFPLSEYTPFSKVSVLSGRYFKLTDKEAEHRERKISDVGVLFSIHLIQILQSHLDFKRIILSWSR